MSAICFYFQVHQPYRLRHYTFFDIGQSPFYEDEDANCGILLKVARKCYLPMNALLLKLIKRHEGRFKISFSISGTALDQFEAYAPEVIQSYRELMATGCVEMLSETYTHSLSFLYSPEEFRAQVRQHDDRIEELFGVRPVVFRNTELIYNNALARAVEDMGYKAILAEGADHVLGWRSPNFLYRPASCEKLKLLLKNYSLSDDIAFRFSNHQWPEFPLTADKFTQWAQAAVASGNIINLFMDYETFGEHQWETTGIFQFMEALPDYILRLPGFGAFGCISAEGLSFSELRQAPHVTIRVPASDMPKTTSAKMGLNPKCNEGKIYNERYAFQKMEGSRLKPNKIPTIQPMMLAKLQYTIYFDMIRPFRYPSALKVPICIRSSSTMRVMDVSATSAATTMKKIGNMPAISSTFSTFIAKLT